MFALEAATAGCMPAISPVLQFVRKMNGSAQSILVEDHDRKLWVVKFKNDLQGPNALANDLIGSKLCRALGLPVPEHKIIFVDSAFCKDGRVWFKTPLGGCPGEPGFHFASRYVPEATGKEAFEMIPSALRSSVRNVPECLGMFLFDVWALHTDSRQALFTSRDDGFYPTFFDHSHLFGGPHGNVSTFAVDGRMLQRLALRSYQQSSLHEAWIVKMEKILPTALKQAVVETPDDWYPGDVKLLSAMLLDRLENLSSLVTVAFAEVRAHIEKMQTNRQEVEPAGFRIVSHRGEVRC